MVKGNIITLKRIKWTDVYIYQLKNRKQFCLGKQIFPLITSTVRGDARVSFHFIFPQFEILNMKSAPKLPATVPTLFHPVPPCSVWIVPTRRLVFERPRFLLIVFKTNTGSHVQIMINASKGMSMFLL